MTVYIHTQATRSHTHIWNYKSECKTKLLRPIQFYLRRDKCSYMYSVFIAHPMFAVPVNKFIDDEEYVTETRVV